MSSDQVARYMHRAGAPRVGGCVLKRQAVSLADETERAVPLTGHRDPLEVGIVARHLWVSDLVIENLGRIVDC